MKGSLYRISERIQTASVPAELPRFAVPIIIFTLFFVISPVIVSHRFVKWGELIRIGLLGFFFLSMFYKKEALPSFGLTPVFIIFMLVSDIYQGNVSLGLNPVPLFGYGYYFFIQTTIGLIILMQFYVKSEDRLIETMKVMILMITATCSLAGFYQLATGSRFANFSSVEGGEFYLETERLISLTGGGAGILTLVSLCFLTGVLMLKERSRFVSILFFINLAALIFTFSRGSYIAAAIILGAAFLLMFQSNKAVIKVNVKNMIALFIVPAFAFLAFIYVGLPYLWETGGISRFLDPANIMVRFEWLPFFSEILNSHLFFGIGLRSDLAHEFWKYTVIYRTPHNFIIAWIMQMGLIPTLILLFMIFRQIIKMIKNLRQTPSLPAYWTGFSLILGYIGILVSSMGGSDHQFFILLMAGLCNAYLKIASAKSVCSRNII